MGELPFAIAIAAGMLAAVNPCGFAMLPGYVTFLIASESGQSEASAGTWRSLGRALAVTGAMTIGFTLVFVGFGLVVTPLALAVEQYLPWVTIVIGLALLGLGGWLASGRELTLLVPKPQPGKPARSLRWAGVYGVTFAIASLSCTIGPFLALTTVAISSSSFLGGLAVFAVYALGMGLVVGVLTVATALARDAVAAWLRRALPYVNRAGGVLLLLAGAYVAWYGVFELRSFADPGATDPVVGALTRVQAAVTRALADAGPVWIGGALAVLLVVGAVVALLSRRRNRAAAEDGSAGTGDIRVTR